MVHSSHSDFCLGRNLYSFIHSFTFPESNIRCDVLFCDKVYIWRGPCGKDWLAFSVPNFHIKVGHTLGAGLLEWNLSHENQFRSLADSHFRISETDLYPETSINRDVNDMGREIE